ncbi:MAG: hypothetical protein Q9163_005572 [Psora crenata]
MSCPPTEVDPDLDDPDKMYGKYVAATGRGLPSQNSGQEVPGASEEDQDILKIIPRNFEAMRAFDSVVRLQKAGELSLGHAQFLQITGSYPSNRSTKGPPRNSDETTDELPSDDQGVFNGPTFYEGYFRVRFRQPLVTQGPKWVIGRGSGKKYGPSRNVDILLAAPGSKDTRGLHAAHAFLHIHKHSGAWLLGAGAEMTVKDQTILPPSSVCLNRPRTEIEIVNMQYIVQFVINTPTIERDYIAERNRVLKEEDVWLPNIDISGIPMENDTVLESIVFRHGLGSGSFGSVFEGFDPKTGNSRVVKRITLKSVQGISTVSNEIGALERFGGREGILELIDWGNSLNGKELQVSQYPVDIFLVFEKGFAFNKVNWKDSAQGWDVKSSLCYQLLMGLQAIHGAKCMHRDITPQNILLFPFKQIPQARLCDFGLFCDRDTDTDTRLAAWKFLPPELEQNRKNEYSQALDIWMLGLALIYSWWPQTLHLEPRKKQDHMLMYKIVWDDTQCGALGHLVARMITWDPESRPSAELACKHRCFQGISNQKKPVKSSNTKRPYEAQE